MHKSMDIRKFVLYNDASKAEKRQLSLFPVNKMF